MRENDQPLTPPSYRVDRGGSWLFDGPAWVRAARRSWDAGTLRRDHATATAVAEFDDDSAIRLLLATDQLESAIERAENLVAGIDAQRRPLAALRAGLLLGSALRRGGRGSEADRVLAPLIQRSDRLGLVRLPADAMAT